MPEQASFALDGEALAARLLREAAAQGLRCAWPLMLGLAAMASVGVYQQAVGAAGMLLAGALLVLWRHRLRRLSTEPMAPRAAQGLQRALVANVAMGGALQAVAFVAWHGDATPGQQTLLALGLGMAAAGAAHSVVLWKHALPWLLLPPLAAAGFVALQTDAALGTIFPTLPALLALALGAAISSLLYADAVRSALDASLAQEATLRDLQCQRDAAAKAAQAKDDFLSTMSHEIRTPLQGLLAGVELAARAEGAANRARWLTAAEASGRSLLDLLNAVLEQARLGARPTDAMLRPTDLGRLLESTASLFNALALSQGLSITVNAAPGTDGLWWADPVRLKQVLGNLVGNAIKFTRSGGVRLELRSLGTEPGVRIDVADTGPGIPAEAFGAIFEPFYRAPGTRLAVPGAGLGLSISKGLVQVMGGSIVAESQVGIGTRITVSLPLRRADDEAAMPVANGLVGIAAHSKVQAGPRAAAPSGRARARVLMAEDNEVIAMITSELLSQEGFDVQRVADGSAAIEARAETAPDVILMDLQMPRLDGLKAARAIREWEARHGTARVPIVVISATVDPASTHTLRDAGIDAWLEKPFTRLHLLQVMDSLPVPANPPAPAAG